MRRVLTLSLVLVAAAPVAALADEVLLRGGGRISGEVVSETPEAVVIEVSAGRLTLPRHRVERVARGTSALAAYRLRAARLAPGDVAGWLELAAWARDNDLGTQARAAWEHVLALDPANATAQRALGNVLVDGRWLSPDESYRARGFVRFEGSWLRPEERQAIHEERAARAAEQRERAEAEARIREAEARARAAEAEARRLEAESAAAAATGGIPYPYVLGGGAYVPYVEEPFLLPPPPPVPAPTRTQPIVMRDREPGDGKSCRRQAPASSTRPAAPARGIGPMLVGPPVPAGPSRDR